MRHDTRWFFVAIKNQTARSCYRVQTTNLGDHVRDRDRRQVAQVCYLQGAALVFAWSPSPYQFSATIHERARRNTHTQKNKRQETDNQVGMTSRPSYCIPGTRYTLKERSSHSTAVHPTSKAQKHTPCNATKNKSFAEKNETTTPLRARPIFDP